MGFFSSFSFFLLSSLSLFIYFFWAGHWAKGTCSTSWSHHLSLFPEFQFSVPCPIPPSMLVNSWFTWHISCLPVAWWENGLDYLLSCTWSINFSLQLYSLVKYTYLERVGELKSGAWLPSMSQEPVGWLFRYLQKRHSSIPGRASPVRRGSPERKQRAFTPLSGVGQE